jgi:hypothetical protein
MSLDPIILGLISTLLGGGVLGAIINQLFTRGKTRAEEKKTDAEAERIKAETAKVLSELNLKSSSPITKNSRKDPNGWFKAGSDPGDYDTGIDQNEIFRGNPSCYIKSRGSPRGFGTIMQMFKATSYLGKRVKLTGAAKSENVEQGAGFWMRVDGHAGTGRPLSFDNMQDRPIKGTTGWTKYQIVLDVPEESVHIAFGLLLDGPGHVWMSNVQFESVSLNTPTTDLLATDYPDKPINLNFDE